MVARNAVSVQVVESAETAKLVQSAARARGTSKPITLTRKCSNSYFIIQGHLLLLKQSLIDVRFSFLLYYWLFTGHMRKNFSKELPTKELSIQLTIKRSLNYFISKGWRIFKTPFFHDEPKLMQFSAVPPGQKEKDYFAGGGGTSLDPSKAILRALGEAVERYALSSFKPVSNYASYNELNGHALDPISLVNFSQKQLASKDFENFRVTRDSKLYWTKGYSIPRKKIIWVPTQLASLPYAYKNEPIIRMPTSTGAAGGTALGTAIYRGICELAERDAFMITYLKKIKKPKVNLQKSDPHLKELDDIYSRYNLELKLYEITSDLKIPSYLSVLIDRTGIGPATTVAAASDIDPLEAAIKASEEAQHSRPWIRRLMQEPKERKFKSLCTLEGRALYWAKPEMIHKLAFLDSGNEVVLSKNRKFTMKEKLSLALKKLDTLGFELIYIDITPKDLKHLGFYVVRVITPGLHPMHLDECYPYLAGKRLKNLGNRSTAVKALNKIPHPFI